MYCALWIRVLVLSCVPPLPAELIAHGDRAYYLTSVWCFMVLKWGLTLFMFARDYKLRYEAETGISLDAPDYHRIA